MSDCLNSEHPTVTGARLMKGDALRMLDEGAATALILKYAGTRLYVPAQVKSDHPITLAIGPISAQVLCDNYSGTTIRIPLGREVRARHYQEQGLSNAKIAVHLGMTEGAVGALFKRLKSSQPTSKEQN